MPPLPGPREMLCCTRYPVITRSWPLSILVGKETSSTRFGVRNTCRNPGSSFRNSAAISNWIWAIRNGFRSSRGAIRGTIGWIAGFTTVAIGVGPFVCSLDSISRRKNLAASLRCCFGPNHKTFQRQTQTACLLGACRSLQNAAFKLHPALFGAKVLSFAVGGCWERQLLCHVHATNGITDQPLSANAWFVGGGVVGVAGRSLVCCTPQYPG